MAEPREIAVDVHVLTVRGANVYLVGSDQSWALIDTGWPGAAPSIRAAAGTLFGPDERPAALLLTHAHPDHVGSAVELARSWALPVHVPAGDLPLLAADVLDNPEVLSPIDRLIAALTCALPRSLRERMSSAELRAVVCPLPQPPGGVPGLPGWRCLAAPGHSPGHVVFFRPDDRVAIVGDVVLTSALWGLVPNWQRISRPPWIASWDWRRSKDAVAMLARLEPNVLASGHGAPLSGPSVARQLYAFSARFSGSPRR